MANIDTLVRMTYGILSVLANEKLDCNHNNILAVYDEISSGIPALQCGEIPGDLMRSLQLSLMTIENVITIPEETYRAERDRICQECAERRDTIYLRYINFCRRKHAP